MTKATTSLESERITIIDKSVAAVPYSFSNIGRYGGISSDLDLPL